MKNSALGLMFLISLLWLNSCSKDKSQQIIGKWDVTWEARGNDFESFEPEQRVMNGKMRFKKNGIVEITAFGFEGCVFSADTLINEIHYDITENTLSFQEEPGKGGLDYHIAEFSKKKIELNLLEDIFLTLEK
ncbi:MAG TPA: hypothetical protein DDY13_17675 [Cytophagales bacterium]|jgi:hypothetical protein|nr:hypothetical protein [Cytophagales bacterium]